jgi:hypothetical protein
MPVETQPVEGLNVTGGSTPIGGAPRYGNFETRVSILPVADQYGVVGEGLAIPLTCAGTGEYELSIYEGFLPDGLSIVGTRIKGVPAATSDSRLVVMVVDGSGRKAQTNRFRLLVSDPVAASFSSATTLQLTQSEAYTTQLTTTAGRAPFSWTLASGTLPTGLELATDGTISGTPTTIESQTVTFTVVDANGTTDTSASITLNVTDYAIENGVVTVTDSAVTTDSRMTVILADASSNAITITLETVGAGRTIAIKKIDGSANAVTIDGDGAETIDGAATATLEWQHETITVAGDDNQWWII